MSTSIVPKGQRRTFLVVSAVVVVAVMIAAREVMLPFILATVLAYVLAPLVLWTERRTRMSRGAAILLVYAVVFGGIGTATHEISPRIAHEFRNLHAELPRLAQEANDHWVPAITKWMREAGIVPAEKPEVETPEPAPSPSGAFVARQQPDGSYVIEVTGGVRVIEKKNGWILEPAREEKDHPF